MCFYCPPDGVTYFGAGFVKKFGGLCKEVWWATKALTTLRTMA